MNLNTLPVNLFDVLLLVVLVAGVFHGRKKGMSGEMLSLGQWLAIVFVSALAYEPVGALFGQTTGVFSTLACYLIAYGGAALVVVLLFMGIKRALGGKLVGSDLFGSAEYYLGMGSGLVRFACVLIAALAILNARHFTAQEVKAAEKFQNDMYGSNFFPTLQSLQATVFEKSLSGPWIRENLSFFLIKPTEPESKDMHQKDAKW